MFSDVRKKVFKYLVAFKYSEKQEIKAKKEKAKTKKEEVKVKKEEVKKEVKQVKEVKKEVKQVKEVKKEVIKEVIKEEVIKEQIQVLKAIVLEEALQTNIKELEENGYTIIHNVYNNEEIEEYKREFFDWYKNTKDVERLHQVIHGNGIFKYFEIGHQRFTWLARTNPKIINIFKHLWNCDEVVTGFDGCCYYPSDYKKEDVYWIHTDQSSHKKGRHCYQSFLI
jgi:hypothetical protein